MGGQEWQASGALFAPDSRHVQEALILFSAVYAYPWPYKAHDHELGIAGDYLSFPRSGRGHADPRARSVKERRSAGEYTGLVHKIFKVNESIIDFKNFINSNNHATT